jgi:4-hydroxybenzoyl-CoA reductase subunit beta
VDVVVSSLGARPRRLRAAASWPKGSPIERLPAALADAAFTECKPLTNLDDEAEWRREMVRVLVRKAVARATGRGFGGAAGLPAEPPSADIE